MPEQDDSILVRLSLGGDQVAFEQLVDRYQKPIFNAALRIINNYEDAADITQLVFIKAFENLESFNPKYKFFSWLYRIAVNESLNYLNGKRQFEHVDEELPSHEKTPHEVVDDLEEKESLQSALMELDEHNRIVVVLRHLHELSYKEISYILDMPEKTVKSRLFTARKLLKDIIQRKRS